MPVPGKIKFCFLELSEFFPKYFQSAMVVPIDTGHIYGGPTVYILSTCTVLGMVAWHK